MPILATGQLLELLHEFFKKSRFIKLSLHLSDNWIRIKVIAMPVELTNEDRKDRIRLPDLVHLIHLNDIEQNALRRNGTCLAHASLQHGAARWVVLEKSKTLLAIDLLVFKKI